MRFILKIAVLALIGCSSKKEVSANLPYEIETVYFQKWIGGQEQTGSGTNFYLQFKHPLPENSTLTKVYFQNKVSVFEKETPTTYLAHFYSQPANRDLILDGDSTKEYGNPAPDLPPKALSLLNNEALIELKEGNKTQQYKIVGIKEKELLAYPSSRPRN